MKIKHVWSVYFSATDTTKTIVKTIAKTIAETLQCPEKELDFTTPKQREVAAYFEKGDIVIFGSPVYAGRIPNLLLKYLSTIKSNGAFGVPVVLFGNRAYEDALIELRDILENGGLHTMAAGAFVGQHSFSENIAKGRPNAEDLSTATNFAKAISSKIESLAEGEIPEIIKVPGTPLPYSGYFKPANPANGKHIDIRKVKPSTNSNCNKCNICVEICPMGAIDPKDPTQTPGICIKCGACIQKCPQHSKSFSDEGYLIHLKDLEQRLSQAANNEIFI